MGRGAWAAHRVELLLEELVHDDVGGARREGEQRPHHLHVLVLQRNLQQVVRRLRLLHRATTTLGARALLEQLLLRWKGDLLGGRGRAGCRAREQLIGPRR